VAGERIQSAATVAALGRHFIIPFSTSSAHIHRLTTMKQLMIVLVPLILSANPASPQSAATATKEKPFLNSLGMKFVPLLEAKVLFSIWETRFKDFDAFVTATHRDMGNSMWVSGSDGWKDRPGYNWKKPGFTQAPDHPVVGVSWNDAVAFCQWLTDTERKQNKITTNQTYRLPTDIEWSAAMGLKEQSSGTPADKDGKIKGLYPWGREWPPPKGAGNYAGTDVRTESWYSGWKPIEGYTDGFPRTAPVGSFAPNNFGLLDLGGNVWEWCEDRFDDKHDWRVLRGGSWHNYVPHFLLASCRVNDPPDKRSDNNGFRVILAGL